LTGGQGVASSNLAVPKHLINLQLNKSLKVLL